MFPLIRVFFDICLFRRGPQDLPTSSFLLHLTLATYAVSSFLLSLGSQPAATAAMAGITDTALLAGLTLSLLYTQGRRVRIPQTLAALAGSGTLLGLIALPPAYWLFSLQNTGSGQTLPIVVPLALIIWGVVVWSLVVMGHIIRSALSTRLVIGLAVAILFIGIEFSVQSALFPPPR